jgi:ACS family hexuronate transporter-like MFS transporter
VRSNYRYTILGLLFLGTTINYIDRQMIGLLKPTLETEFRWSEKDYANIVFWFQAMYAAGYLLAGRFVDRVGVKTGYGLAVLVWSLAGMAHSLARSTTGFMRARGALGFAEGGNMPAVIKSIAEWFPVRERSFASGFMISGTTVGPIIAPVLVLWLAYRFSWQTSFLVTGLLGMAWVIAWYFFYDKPEKSRSVNSGELSYIHSDAFEAEKAGENKQVPIKTLLGKGATWGYLAATMLTDPVWWFYLFWLPSYLTSNGMPKDNIALPVSLVYAITAILSIAGGWLSSYLIRMKWSVNRSRKSVMLLCVFLAMSVLFIRYTGNIWIAVMIIALAAAAQTIWKGVLLTTVADQFPKRAVSTVAGIGGLGGATGGMLAAWGVGALLERYKLEGHLQNGYNLVFLFCGLSYLIAISCFHFLSPGLKKVEV